MTGTLQTIREAQFCQSINVVPLFLGQTRTNLDYGGYYEFRAACGQDINRVHKGDDWRHDARREDCYQAVSQPFITNDSEKAYWGYEQSQIG